MTGRGRPEADSRIAALNGLHGSRIDWAKLSGRQGIFSGRPLSPGYPCLQQRWAAGMPTG